MNQDDLDKSTVSTSKFYMFRSLIAMAHADGHVCDEERAYMTAFINRLPFTQEQRQSLEDDLETAQNIKNLLPYINDPKYRGQLPYFARLMAFKDGELHPNEEKLLAILEAHAVNGLDMEAIKEETQKAVAYDISVHNIELDKLRPQGGLFGAFDKLMLSMNVDLMKD